ncbi:hypothetical protein KVR01_012982 [Diaporthe batatas]|uniref:uncharacterized protein n=1 Tax=Diaporthe batatas TaxID=748121 RepID=UPI001D05895D|nr:uncharacterized protein KVR01_012982 [Diaporthe batatas]KAG8157274.1 hypothetical protein KVR01_012982 [Diaporthe batatas]
MKFDYRPTEWVMGLKSSDRQSHPIYGIMGGTWPKANPRFVLPPGIKKSTIGTHEKVAAIVEEYKLSQPFLVAPTGGVCFLDDGNGTLCGKVFQHPPTMNRHMYHQHTGQIVPYTTGKHGPLGDEVFYLSERGLYKFVLDGVWKNAIFVTEPENADETPVGKIALWLEQLAKTDENFDVARYGNKFARRRPLRNLPSPPSPQPPAGPKRRRKDDRDDDDDDDDDDEYERKCLPPVPARSLTSQ